MGFGASVSRNLLWRRTTTRRASRIIRNSTGISSESPHKLWNGRREFLRGTAGQCPPQYGRLKLQVMMEVY